MKSKKIEKILIGLILFVSIMLLTGCSKTNEYLTATLNENDDIIIDLKEVNNEATFINYEVDNTIMQITAVKLDSDDQARIVLNTCQACNPSPQAYFVKEGEYLVCQNCRNKFKIDEIGIEKGGCNPIPITEMTIENDEELIKNKNYLLEYKEKFENWEGPIK